MSNEPLKTNRPDTLCVFCDEICEAAPTKRGWSMVGVNGGLHFDCARKVVEQGEYINKEEAQFVSQPSGLRWVKAGKRLPGQDKVCRKIGCVDVMDSYDFLQGVKYGRLLLDEWEWLDESPLPSTKGEDELKNEIKRLAGMIEDEYKRSLRTSKPGHYSHIEQQEIWQRYKALNKIP